MMFFGQLICCFEIGIYATFILVALRMESPTSYYFGDRSFWAVYRKPAYFTAAIMIIFGPVISTHLLMNNVVSSFSSFKSDPFSENIIDFIYSPFSSFEEISKVFLRQVRFAIIFVIILNAINHRFMNKTLDEGYIYTKGLKGFCILLFIYKTICALGFFLILLPIGDSFKFFFLMSIAILWLPLNAIVTLLYIKENLTNRFSLCVKHEQ